MIKRELLKPRKVIWVMRDFINEIHGLTYTDYIVPKATKENETVDEFLERFRNGEEIEVPSTVKMVYREDGFAVRTDERDDSEFHFSYNIDELYSRGHKQFAQDFFTRCPMSRGFASVTITILHEIGHMNSQQEFEGYERIKAIKE